MEQKKNRKTDRRTVYTRNAIKDAVLELMKKCSFNEVSIAAVCRQAEITRSTFYLHYDNLTQVLEELIHDALNLAESGSDGNITNIFEMLGVLKPHELPEYLQEHSLALPPCHRIADHEKYKVLFKDEEISSFITKTIFQYEKDNGVGDIKKITGLPDHICLLLFLFNLNGAYALNKHMNWVKDDTWYEAQAALMTYMKGGYEALKKQK